MFITMEVAIVTLKSTASYKYSPIPFPPPTPHPPCWSPGGSLLTMTKQLWLGWGKGRSHSSTKFVGHEAFSELWNDLAVTECPGFKTSSNFVLGQQLVMKLVYVIRYRTRKIVWLRDSFRGLLVSDVVFQAWHSRMQFSSSFSYWCSTITPWAR